MRALDMTSKPKNQFRQTEIGKIPEDWDVKSLSDIAEFAYGKMPKKEDIVSEGYPIFSGYKITGFHKTYNSTKPKLILVARGVGGTGDVKIAPPMTFITNLSIIFDLNEDSINLQFLYYYLHRGLRYLDSGSAQSQITISDLRQVKVAIPLLPEQQAIAKIFSDIDSKIERNHRVNKTLEAIGQAIFKRWFVDFEFPNEEGKPYKSSGGEMVYNSELSKNIPKTWVIGNFGDIAKTQPGFAFQSEDFTDNGYKVIKIADIQNSTVDIQDGDCVIEDVANAVDHRFHVASGDIVIAMTGAKLGKVGIVPEAKIKMLLNQRVGKVVSEHKFFAYLFLQKDGTQSLIRGFSSGSSAQGNISNSDIENIRVVLPDNGTLHAFTEMTYPLYEKLTHNSGENLVLAETRDLLLPRLMSGKIRVSIPKEVMEKR